MANKLLQNILGVPTLVPVNAGSAILIDSLNRIKKDHPGEYALFFNNLEEIYITGIEHHADPARSIDLLCFPIMNTVLLFSLIKKYTPYCVYLSSHNRHIHFNSTANYSTGSEARYRGGVRLIPFTSSNFIFKGADYNPKTDTIKIVPFSSKITELKEEPTTGELCALIYSDNIAGWQTYRTDLAQAKYTALQRQEVLKILQVDYNSLVEYLKKINFFFSYSSSTISIFKNAGKEIINTVKSGFNYGLLLAGIAITGFIFYKWKK